MKCTKRKARRLSELGIAGIETIAETERLQRDMLRQLERNLSDAARLAGLAHCAKNYCGRKKCAEVCQFGTRRRRRKEIPEVHGLINECAGPFCEVRVGRGTWAQPAGSLTSVSIAAAKKLNRMALDSLYNPGLIAVGTFKVSTAPKHEGEGWKCEIHQIVACAEKAELENAFSTSRPHPGNFLRVREVTNLGQTISEVLKRDVQAWQHPYQPENKLDRPKRARRTEYYEWRLDLKPGDRMVRYGCDRHYNKLQKAPRLIVEEVPKKRPYPVQLTTYMYGNHPQNCKCYRCLGPYPLN